MSRSKLSVASWVVFASLVLVLGLIGWLQGVSPFRVAQAAGLIDDSFADFSGGTGCYVQASGLDGEVIVTSTIDTEFPGSTLPAGWFTTTLTTLVTGGQLVVDEGTAGTSDVFVPSRTLEFTATFTASSGQLAGLGVANYSVAPFAIFNSNGTDLLVRTDAGSGETSGSLGGGYFGAPHHYRIDWGATAVVYSVDGADFVTHSIAITDGMSVLFQDFSGTSLTVDWARLWPWACTYTSHVFDSGVDGSSFNGLSTTLSTPAGTAIAFEVITSTNSITWSAWLPVNADGTFISSTARYLQYRAALSAPDPLATPEIQYVRVRGFGPPPTAVRVTTFTAAAPDFGTRALLIGLIGGVLVLGTTRVIWRRRKGQS